jgi:hypothetical protein
MTEPAAANRAATNRDVPVMRPLIRTGLPHQKTDCRDQEHQRDPADRFDVTPQRRFGTHAADADHQRDQVHALAAADQHAQHVLRNRHADNTGGPCEDLHRNRRETAQNQQPEHRPRRFGHLRLNRGDTAFDTGQHAHRGEQRLDRLERKVPQGVADQRAHHRTGQADRREPEAARGCATHIGASITSGMIGKMIASMKLNPTR